MSKPFSKIIVGEDNLSIKDISQDDIIYSDYRQQSLGINSNLKNLYMVVNFSCF